MDGARRSRHSFPPSSLGNPPRESRGQPSVRRPGRSRRSRCRQGRSQAAHRFGPLAGERVIRAPSRARRTLRRGHRQRRRAAPSRRTTRHTRCADRRTMLGHVDAAGRRTRATPVRLRRRSLSQIWRVRANRGALWHPRPAERSSAQVRSRPPERGGNDRATIARSTGALRAARLKRISNGGAGIVLKRRGLPRRPRLLGRPGGLWSFTLNRHRSVASDTAWVFRVRSRTGVVDRGWRLALLERDNLAGTDSDLR